MIQSIDSSKRAAGERAIADKIVKRLHDLEKTVESNQGRWAWELLQNAKDSIAAEHNRAISVQIVLNDTSVEFSHNGGHFTDQDLTSLISQISSKETEDGEIAQKTGRFGTGFLTTHLLSRVVKIKGILATEDESFYRFNFLLDRRGKTATKLMPRIAKSWEDCEQSAELINSDYDEEHFNTSFCYQIETKEQKEVASIGVKEFSKLIPFVLTFIPKINSVEIIDNISENRLFFQRQETLEDELIVKIKKLENSQEKEILILCNSDDHITIATEVQEVQNGYSIKSIKDLPKLFCDFPLIGTESFHFPVIVNSFFFNPQTERDGVWLKGNEDGEVRENQEILEIALDLYKELISEISEEDFFDLYNIAETKTPSVDKKYLDEKWYQKHIQEPLRDFIYEAEIVELEDSLESSKKSISELYFPKKGFSEDIRDEIWSFIFDIAPNSVCKESHLHNWCNISWKGWDTVDYKTLVEEIEEFETIHKLSKDLEADEHYAIKWLNELGDFLLGVEDHNLPLLKRHSIIPNQNGNFKRSTELFIDEIRDDELIQILALLGEDWKDILVHDRIRFIREELNPKNKKNIANNISNALRKRIKVSAYRKDTKFVTAITLLSEWFEKNKEQGKELFPIIYPKRAELFMNTIQDKEGLYQVMRMCNDFSKLAKVAQAIEDDSEIIEKIQEAKGIDKLLEKFDANNVSELESMLKLAKDVLEDDSKKIEITQETLLSLGVTSLAELEKALQDKGIAAKFMHTSTPTVEMFMAVQNLIERTKTNVIQHLKTLDDYDCSELEELAPTVIGGIKKEELPIYIVVRPSDNGEVIIYYSSEKDTLDDPSSELWIDDGVTKPRRLSLGQILKTTGINRIPIE